MAHKGDNRKDLIQQCLSFGGLELCLALLCLIKFFDQDIHDKRLFHVVGLRANAVHALDEVDEVVLLVARHQEVI